MALDVRRCKSCDAEIFWALTPSQRMMPIDVGGAPPGKGNVVLRPSLKGHGLTATTVPVGEGTHTSHFASCPGAREHRRR